MHPNPGKAAKTYFQAARPINADWIRILRVPAAPLRENFFCEAIVSREAVCLGKCDQVLMTVQLPGDLAVADFRKIQVLDPVEGLPGCVFLMDGVEVPIDRLSVI